MHMEMWGRRCRLHATPGDAYVRSCVCMCISAGPDLCHLILLRRTRFASNVYERSVLMSEFLYEARLSVVVFQILLNILSEK